MLWECINCMQTVIDGVLFEPGLWQSINHPMMKAESLMWSPLMIAPISARPVACCSTNELQKSPQGLMKALSDLLEFAIELDTGKYSQGTAPVILYVIRIITRVESFIHVVPDEISQLGPNTNEWCWLGCILSRSRVFPSTNQTHDQEAQASANDHQRTSLPHA